MEQMQKRSPQAQVENLDDFIKTFFGPTFSDLSSRKDDQEVLSSTNWIPKVDIYQEDDEFHVNCECPGMESDDFNISMNDNILTISGERERENEIDEENYYRSEREFSRFERSFKLPTNIRTNGVDAQYENGVLKIVLPIAESDQQKTIEIV